MTFRTVVFKNFKGNLKQYLAYFLCSTYTITIFFMYSILLFNDQIGDEDTQVLGYVFPVAMVAIAVFSVFFITYAHSAFVKGRNKEFGIYITLGMDAKELNNMVNIENSIIGGASLVSGILIGTLFSRLFQMVILSLLQIEEIEYQLSYKAFLLTGVVFLAIFGVVFGITSMKMKRTDITSLLREARKSEGKKYTKKDTVLGFVGVLTMIVSAGLVFVITGNQTLCSSPFILLLFAIPGFLGVYLTLSHGGNLLIHCLRKTQYYMRHMLEISEIHYKFNANKRIIFILSILSAMTIVFIASPFSLLSLSTKLADDGSHHLEFAETIDRNCVSEQQLDEVLNQAGANVVATMKLPFLYLYQTADEADLSNTRVIMPVSEYNSFASTSYSVLPGEAINVHANWIPGTFGVEVGEVYTLYGGTYSYDFQIQASGRGTWIVELNTFPSQSAFIINDEEYEKIYGEVTKEGKDLEQVGYYHLIDFKNWKKESKAVEAVEALITDQSLPVNSVLSTYENLKSGYSVFFFVSTVMGILFFVSGGGVLYFKQFTELNEARKTFYKLFKIGITEKEMNRLIGNELRVIFFLPLIFGTFLGISLIYMMTFLFGGGFVVKEFMKNSWIVVALYFVSQNLSYFITKKKYVSEMIRER